MPDDWLEDLEEINHIAEKLAVFVRMRLAREHRHDEKNKSSNVRDEESDEDPPTWNTDVMEASYLLTEKRNQHDHKHHGEND